MTENTAKNILATPFNLDQLEPLVDEARTSPFQKVGKLAVRAVRAASNAATTGAMALARSVIKTIHGTRVMRPQGHVRKQQYINLRDIKDHVCGIVGHLKINRLTSWMDRNKTGNKNEKRHKVVLPRRLKENDILDLLDDAFAPSFVQRGEEAGVDYKNTSRITRDLLIDLGSSPAGARR